MRHVGLGLLALTTTACGVEPLALASGAPLLVLSAVVASPGPELVDPSPPSEAQEGSGTQPTAPDVGLGGSPTPAPPGGGVVGGGGVGGGGTGGGAPTTVLPPAPPVVSLAGELLADGPNGPGAPVAGATVEAITAWGRFTTTSDAAGRFAVNSYGPAGVLSAQADGFLPTAAAAWTGGVLHLRALDPVVQRAPAQELLTARVLDDQGLPVAGAKLVAQDAWGAYFGPFTTAADGRCSGLGIVMGEVAPGGLAVWAWQEGPDGGPEALGHAVRVPTLSGSVGDVALQGPAGRVLLGASTGPVGNELASVIAVDAGGLPFTLVSWGSAHQGPREVNRFALPNVRLEAEVQRLGAGGARSGWRGPLGQDPNLSARLLDYPAFTGPVRSGGEATWATVPDASAYVLEARHASLQRSYWEAYAAASPLRLPSVGVPVAESQLLLTALAGDGATANQLLSVGLGLDAPRALRWQGTGERASRWSRAFVPWTP